MDRQADLSPAAPPSQWRSYDDDLIALDACAALDAIDIGRKASVLAWAGAQGLSTPGGMVLPASRFWAALEACGSRTQAQYLAAHTMRLDPRHSMDLAAGIHASLALPAVTRLARGYAQAAWRRLPTRPLVARSSSVLEDGPMAAFPGVFQSRLDLRSADALADAIVACWQSAFSPIALQYLHRMRAEPVDFSLAVLIQPQIKADWYGLYVSADPMSGAPTPVVELTQQGPDALVGGAAAAVRARQVNTAWSLEGGGPDLAAALASVSAMAARLSARVPGHVDIEFALVSTDAAPVLLQCRPVTPARMPMAPSYDGIRSPGVAGRPCAPGSAAGLVLRPGQPPPGDVPLIAVVDRLTTDDYDLIFRHCGIISINELSPLSHVAILCRELGVPLVCGAGPGAKTLLGAWILLDGSSGVAEIVSAPTKADVCSRVQETVLYVADVERTLRSLICSRLSASTAGEPGQRLAREVGLTQARILATPLAPAEAEQLAVIAQSCQATRARPTG